MAIQQLQATLSPTTSLAGSARLNALVGAALSPTTTFAADARLRIVVRAALSPTTTLAVSARQILRVAAGQSVFSPRAAFGADPQLYPYRLQAVLAPAAVLKVKLRQISSLRFVFSSEVKLAANATIGGFVDIAGTLTAEVWFGGDADLIKKVGTIRDRVDPFPLDPLNPGILEHGGSLVIFKNATGLEKAFADVDAQRLTATYAELPRDQWDPDRIVYRNLAYLAWAIGVNLWEDDWPEAFRRYWVKYQWTRKYERGSPLGLRNFVNAINAGGKVHAEVKRLIRPPAITYPLGQVGNIAAAIEALVPGARYSGKLTNTHVSYDELDWLDLRPKPDWQDLIDYERRQYVARFAQLRGYPYIGRVQLRWLCFLGPQHRINGTPLTQRNGRYLGPLWKLYPTIQDAGGKYTYTYVLWDRGVETTLTHRAIARVTMGPSAGWGFTPGVSQYDDQVLLPLPKDIDYFMGEAKYLGAGARYGIFAGPAPPLRVITVSRSGPLPLTQGKAQYQTILPTEQLLDLIPEKVAVRHPIRKTEWYLDHAFLRGALPRSNAWQFMYDRWYLFDADRVPNYRKTSVYMGNCRFGIHKYTAEALIKLRVKQSNYYPVTTGYLRGYAKPFDSSPIDKVRRAICASMALRDTVLINTAYTRRMQLRDIIRPDGSHKVSQLVSN